MELGSVQSVLGTQSWSTARCPRQSGALGAALSHGGIWRPGRPGSALGSCVWPGRGYTWVSCSKRRWYLRPGHMMAVGLDRLDTWIKDRNNCKYWDIWNKCYNCPNIWTTYMWFCHTVIFTFPVQSLRWTFWFATLFITSWTANFDWQLAMLICTRNLHQPMYFIYINNYFELILCKFTYIDGKCS